MNSFGKSAVNLTLPNINAAIDDALNSLSSTEALKIPLKRTTTRMDIVVGVYKTTVVGDVSAVDFDTLSLALRDALSPCTVRLYPVPSSDCVDVSVNVVVTVTRYRVVQRMKPPPQPQEESDAINAQKKQPPPSSNKVFCGCCFFIILIVIAAVACLVFFWTCNEIVKQSGVFDSMKRLIEGDTGIATNHETL